jgi:hypothetical protein
MGPGGTTITGINVTEKRGGRCGSYKVTITEIAGFRESAHRPCLSQKRCVIGAREQRFLRPSAAARRTRMKALGFGG